LMVVLLYKENFMLDQFSRALENKFITEGGYTENLFKKRLQQRGK
jgi:four helix bundle suffix protein